MVAMGAANRLSLRRKIAHPGRFFIAIRLLRELLRDGLV
jgi:hypothetical protein